MVCDNCAEALYCITQARKKKIEDNNRIRSLVAGLFKGVKSGLTVS